MPWSIYLHVPFCEQRCAYCSFYSGEPLSRRQGYIALALLEARLRRDAFPAAAASTLYLGGGTPTLLGEEVLETFIGTLSGLLGLEDGAEVTVETNPAIELDFGRLRAGGATRLSVGVQSLYAEHLHRLGRSHTPDEAEETIRAAVGAGLEVSGDLMYGFAGLEPGQLARDVARLADWGVNHLSAYSLETPRACAARARFDRAGLAPAPEPVEQAQWEALVEAADRAGLAMYEVSNFSRPGRASRHNRAYWTGDAYMGLGPGASGFEPHEPPFGVRYTNAPDLDGYEQAVRAERLPPGEREPRSRDDALLERLFLQLRMANPFSPMDWVSDLGLDSALLDRALERLVAQGDLQPSGPGLLRPTPHGMRRADGLSLWLLEQRAVPPRPRR